MNATPMLVNWLQRRGRDADALCRDGRVLINVPGGGRIELRPLQAGPWAPLLLSARIAPLASERGARERQVDRLLRGACARMAAHPQQLALDADAEDWVLQQRCDDDLAPLAFERELERFGRALRFWQALERS